MFRFAHTELLIILIVIPLLIVFYRIMLIRKKRDISKFGNFKLLSPLMEMMSIRRESWKFVLSIIGVALVIIAAAGPQFGSKLQKVEKKGVEVMILLDVSNSMMAQDIKPNRLEKAKMSISRVIEGLKDDKLGIIVFAGDAYVQLPITTDYSSAKLFLSTINPEMIPVQGTSIGAAINLATKSFSSDNEISKAIIVITDGEDHESGVLESVKLAREKGIVVHSIGMGLEGGAPVPEPGKKGDYMKDAQGNVVVSKLDENMLKSISKEGEGLYVRASNERTGINALFSEINRMNKSLIEERVYTDYDEKYQYFLILGLIFIFIEMIILGRKNKKLMSINIFNNKKEADNV